MNKKWNNRRGTIYKGLDSRDKCNDFAAFPVGRQVRWKDEGVLQMLQLMISVYTYRVMLNEDEWIFPVDASSCYVTSTVRTNDVNNSYVSRLGTCAELSRGAIVRTTICTIESSKVVHVRINNSVRQQHACTPRAWQWNGTLFNAN